MMSRVWSEASYDGSRLLLLLALADYSNDQGTCWPSVADLAKKSRMSERTVQRALKEFADDGVLEIVVGGFVGGLNRASTYTIRGDRLSPGDTGDTPGVTELRHHGGDTAMAPQPSLEPSLEPSETLFEIEPDGPTSDPDAEVFPDSAQIVWDHYLSIFGDKLRIRELTERRRRMIERALKAVSDQADVLIDAVDGLKSYRDRNQSRSQNTDLSVIFETGPHSRSNLTDQIEWWAQQAPGKLAGEAAVPPILRERVRRRKVQVVEMIRQPHNPGAQERGAEAVTWLAEHAHIRATVDTDGKIEWETIK